MWKALLFLCLIETFLIPWSTQQNSCGFTGPLRLEYSTSNNDLFVHNHDRNTNTSLNLMRQNFPGVNLEYYNGIQQPHHEALRFTCLELRVFTYLMYDKLNCISNYLLNKIVSFHILLRVGLSNSDLNFDTLLDRLGGLSVNVVVWEGILENDSLYFPDDRIDQTHKRPNTLTFISTLLPSRSRISSSTFRPRVPVTSTESRVHPCTVANNTECIICIVIDSRMMARTLITISRIKKTSAHLPNKSPGGLTSRISAIRLRCIRKSTSYLK